MSETHTARGGSGAILREDGTAATTGAADLLYFSAAPTFAIMALLTGVLGGGSPDALCSSAGASDVPADERFPHGALAEADLPSARRHASVS
jgi:hypothetical protein